MNKVLEEINSLEEVKRLKILEKYIDNNEVLNKKFQEIKEIQKQLVNATHYNLINSKIEYEKLYNEKKEEILEYPFLEEYFEILEDVNNMLKNIFKTMEAEINL